MKIRIEDSKGNGVSLETPDDRGLSYIDEISAKMRDLITHVRIDAIKSDIVCNEQKAVPATPVVSDRETLIRPRIPNNLVDVKDLTVKQAVTEQALVRCPNCGQSHVLAVNAGNRIYMMRKFYSLTGNDEFRIIAEFDSLTSQDLVNMCCKPETDRKAYFEDIQKVKMIDDKDFAVNNETEVFCPVCCQSDTFFKWKSAYENPLNYFETECICDACGGEKLEKIVKNHKVYQCDKCGLQTDFKEE